MEFLALIALAVFIYAMIDAIDKSSKQYKQDKAAGLERYARALETGGFWHDIIKI